MKKEAIIFSMTGEYIIWLLRRIYHEGRAIEAVNIFKEMFPDLPKDVSDDVINGILQDRYAFEGNTSDPEGLKLIDLTIPKRTKRAVAIMGLKTPLRDDLPGNLRAENYEIQ